ncbi:AtpZ/AtpI family protein [Cohnella lubricantis]|uniref:AtpZ/AtpI family protein n=1 Tax=Cohnella lubricantis TaxID=2163172 RepID=A0A841TBK5_9BACL|nr:AtpZ/AtpI family protein [Cohnella lubricantis]MBB6676758.1 AtpZ/AtpI family protein [Cohnella lubricantis]MBP2117804.1 F0F1-type ATP synthase assembly protein I [Cohnella lubricantis]
MPESRRPPPPPPDENPWRAAGLVTAIGVELAVCVGLGWWIGAVADRHNGTEKWYLAGLVVGLVAGIGSAIGLIRKFAGERRK